MEEITINELVTNEKYSQYLPKNEIKFFKEMHRFNVKKRVIEKLKRVYSYVECKGRGDRTTFTLGEPIEGAVVDKRSIATTNPVVLKLAQNANMSLTRSMIGEIKTAKQWLRLIGFDLFYINKFELDRKIRELVGSYDPEIKYSNIDVDLTDYEQPTLLDVFEDYQSRELLIEKIGQFYGYIFRSVESHANIKFEKRYAVLDDEDERIVLTTLEQVTLETFEKNEISEGKSRKDLIKSKEYGEFIHKRFNAKRIWREWELTSCKNGVKNEVNNKSDIFDGCVKMFMSSMVNREIGKNKIPYEFEIENIKKSDEIKELIELGLAVDLTNERTIDNIEFRLIKDRLLVLGTAKIIELMNLDYKVDLTEYEIKKIEWLENFRKG
ncbi:hypothetical protein [Liquorilactobacillus hordei]|uniref:hypothetical protein n=1 Tax=Liquorilactobacillus hordei TaxID=468911 RepID=UPI0039E95763